MAERSNIGSEYGAVFFMIPPYSLECGAYEFGTKAKTSHAQVVVNFFPMVRT